MGMRLEVNFGDGWKLLRTAEADQPAKQYAYLKEQQNGWFQNGEPKFRSALYRIGSYSYFGGEPLWNDYKPESIAVGA